MQIDHDGVTKKADLLALIPGEEGEEEGASEADKKEELEKLIKAEKEAMAVCVAANDKHAKARTAREKAQAEISGAAAAKVHSKKELEEMSDDYFERFPDTNQIFASEDGTFFFRSQDLKAAKGPFAKVHQFKRS